MNEKISKAKYIYKLLWCDVFEREIVCLLHAVAATTNCKNKFTEAYFEFLFCMSLKFLIW